jgi:hypothetical protein
MKISCELTGKEMRNVLEAVRDAAEQEGFDTDDDTLYRLCKVVDAALEEMGIAFVADADDFHNAVMNAATDDEEEEEEAEEEDEEEDEEEIPVNPALECFEELVIVQNGQRWLPESAAKKLVEDFKRVVNMFAKGQPEEVKQKILCDAWEEFGRQLNVAGVLMGK